MSAAIIYRLFAMLCILLMIHMPSADAQTNEKDTLGKTDTTGIIEKIVEKIDTMVRTAVTDSALQKWSDNPIDSVLFRNNNSRFKKELYNLIVRGTSDTLKTPTTNTTFAAMDGRIIRRIVFDYVDIFAPSVTDTNYVPVSWFEKTVNSSHNDTRQNILSRYLLLKPGDKLDVFLAAENERILRDLSFIMDARFIARPVPGSPDSVDILLITQDKFPIGFEADLEKSTLAVLGISHQNVLGYGHQFSATSYWDAQNKPFFGFRVSYGTSNLGGTFTTGRLEYTHKWNQETYLVDLERDFRAMSLRNAGGISFENTELVRNVDMLDTLFRSADLKYSRTDMWIGRFLLPIRYPSQRMRSNIFLAGRWNKYNSIDAPQIDDSYLYSFSDRTMLLFSAGLFSQGFRKDNLIYTFGRTEDVPFGYMFGATVGEEWSEDKTRTYFSLGAGYSTYLSSSAYLFSQIRFGTFLHRGSTEQGTFKFSIGYFSALHEHNRFRYRNFINLSYLNGINRYPGEFTSISNQGGINGLISKSMRGSDKLVLNLESVLFTPYVLFGFRFAMVGGLDLGVVMRDYDLVYHPRIFSGLNFGVRIRNDQLVFDTFVIRFSLFPGRAKEGSAQYFMIDQVPRIRFNDFFPDKPDIVPYQ